MSISRRGLFTGAWLKEVAPEPVEERGPVHWLKRKARVVPKPVLASVAKVMDFSCLNMTGSFCSTCVERCPEAGAIALDGRTPKVDPAVCTGCGDCVRACPAPGGAILLVPEGL